MKLIVEERADGNYAVFCGTCRGYIGSKSGNKCLDNLFVMADNEHTCKDEHEQESTTQDSEGG